MITMSACLGTMGQPGLSNAPCSQLFAVFEELTSQHEMTKVDIIGDCFMAVSGMLYPDTPEECAVKACRLVSVVDRLMAILSSHYVVYRNLHVAAVRFHACRCSKAAAFPFLSTLQPKINNSINSQAGATHRHIRVHVVCYRRPLTWYTVRRGWSQRMETLCKSE